jgi:predicted HTH transcriptional regulator
MQQMAEESDVRDLMLPMMDRLGKSGLKMAAIIAATERLDDKIEIGRTDIVHAFSYIERWMEYSISVVTNAGKSADERELERIVNYIIDKPGVTRGNIMQRFRLNSRVADGVFSTMLQRGLATSQKGGNAQRFYPIRMIQAPGDKETVEFR